MFGLRKWEKFRDRVLHSNIGLNKQELNIAFTVILVSKPKNKTELVIYLQAFIRQQFGSFTSVKFQKNRQAMRYWNTLKKIKENLEDQENFKG